MSALYRSLRPVLFALSPEFSHELTLSALRLLGGGAVASSLFGKGVSDPYTALGLQFPNRVGLAAGLDKNGAAIPAMSAMGFGFIEVGTVTPLPQPGNPKPRLFRLRHEQAIINRMGFNNCGSAALLDNVRRAREVMKLSAASGASPAVLGINIGKNKNTPPESANDDYLQGLEAAYKAADYVTINVSSPNTSGLRDLQFGEQLDALLFALREKRKLLEDIEAVRKPLLVKVAPDMEDDALCRVADRLLHFGVDGVIATNTTLARDAVQSSVYANEAGGLSGLPLQQKATHSIRVLSAHAGDALTIMGVGGIDSGASAIEKIHAGAHLVQLYSGLIYRGPGLVGECAGAIAALRQENCKG